MYRRINKYLKKKNILFLTIGKDLYTINTFLSKIKYLYLKKTKIIKNFSLVFMKSVVCL